MSLFDAIFRCRSVLMIFCCHQLIFWCRNTIIFDVVFDVKIWYHVLMSYFHVIIGYHKLMSYFDVIIAYHNLMSYFDVIIGYHNLMSLMSESDILVLSSNLLCRCQNLLSYFDMLILRSKIRVRCHSFCYHPIPYFDVIFSCHNLRFWCDHRISDSDVRFWCHNLLFWFDDLMWWHIFHVIFYCHHAIFWCYYLSYRILMSYFWAS